MTKSEIIEFLQNVETRAIGVHEGLNYILKFIINEMRLEKFIKPNKYSETIDYAYWMQLPGWNLHEASSITLLIDPDKLKDIQDAEDEESILLLKDYNRRLRFLERSHEMEIINFFNSPKETIDYLSTNNMKIPVFSAFGEAFKIAPTDYKKKYSLIRKKYNNLVKEYNELSDTESDVSNRTKTLLSKMIYAMAWYSFQYTHISSSSSVTLIENAIKAAGFNGPKDDFIRKHLKDAADQIENTGSDELPPPKREKMKSSPS